MSLYSEYSGDGVQTNSLMSPWMYAFASVLASLMSQTLRLRCLSAMASDLTTSALNPISSSMAFSRAEFVEASIIVIESSGTWAS